MATAETLYADSFESRSPWGPNATTEGDVPAPTVVSGRYDVMEPISPELVLVDPELAARLRALPIDLATPPVVRRHDGLIHAVERTPYRALARQRAARAEARPRRRAFKRVSGALLAGGLLVVGFVAAAAVSGAQGEQPRFEAAAGNAPAADRPPAPDLAPSAKTTARVRRAAKPQRRPRSTVKRKRTPAANRRTQPSATSVRARETSAAVERQLLSVIVQSPAGKLPPALINRRTGLAKNNLQAVCTRGRNSRTFLCVVKSALQPAAGTVYAIYRARKNGRGSFTWYRSRSS